MSDSLMHWHEIRARMRQAGQSVSAASVPAILIAVSKKQPSCAIAPLLAAGQYDWAENKVQEAEEKWPGLIARHPAARLHLIGSLQSNKAREALMLFDCIETLDRPSLIEAVAKERARAQTRCTQFFVQVNTGEEPQKGGVTPQALEALLALCETHAVPVSGLMCIPPAEDPPAPHFALLATLARRFGLPHLSMGMSHDFETAIRLGATHVRVGTALFGERR